MNVNNVIVKSVIYFKIKIINNVTNVGVKINNIKILLYT